MIFFFSFQGKGASPGRSTVCRLCYSRVEAECGAEEKKAKSCVCVIPPSSISARRRKAQRRKKQPIRSAHREESVCELAQNNKKRKVLQEK